MKKILTSGLFHSRVRNVCKCIIGVIGVNPKQFPDKDLDPFQSQTLNFNSVKSSDFWNEKARIVLVGKGSI